MVGLSACSQDDALTPDSGTDNGNTIRFTTAIARFTNSDAADAPGTRATINDDGKGSFANGDETEIIGIAYTNTGHCLSQRTPRHLQGRNVDYRHDMG